jgi:hypothetical protein
LVPGPPPTVTRKVVGITLLGFRKISDYK